VKRASNTDDVAFIEAADALAQMGLPYEATVVKRPKAARNLEQRFADMAFEDIGGPMHIVQDEYVYLHNRLPTGFARRHRSQKV